MTSAPAAVEGAPAPTAGRAGAWGTLVTVALGVVMVGLDGTVVSIANPAIGRSLHASLADLQWITNGYLLALAVGLIPGGKLGDRYGRRLVFLVGVAGFALSSVGVAVAGSVAGAIAMRTVQGLFGALLLPNTIALLRAAFPPEELNRAVGIWSSSSAAAIAGGPVIGGFLVEKVNWQSVFLLNVPVSIATIVCGLAVMPESRESIRQRFDAAGLVLLAGAVFCLVYGVIRSESTGWSSPVSVALLSGSAVLTVVFVLVEQRRFAPLLPMHLFANRSISLGVVTLLLNFFALYGVLFFVSLYFQNVQHLDAVQGGLRLLPLIGVFSLTSPYAGRITTRFGARLPITAGLLLSTASLLGMLTIGPRSPFWSLCPGLVGIGLGVALVVVASTEAIIANAPVDEAGLAGGLQGIAIQLGGVLGSSILGSVLAARVDSVLPHPFPIARQLVDQGVVPAGSSAAVTATAHASFLSGLHVALVVGGLATLVGAFCGPFIRADLSQIAEPVTVAV
ncbi:MAG TPA: MFS transporter [Acidimicrobiales bacterium]|nr:MFS transporter [Acidimicrobiales bacterium]